MSKKIILILSVILVLLSVPALAALEYTTTLLYFNVGALDEISVQILGGVWNVSAPAGTATLYNIEFNTTLQYDAWVNAKTAGVASTQTDSNGIIVIDNTGTTTPTALNISTNVSSWGSGNYNCTDLHYFANNSADAVYGAATPASEIQLNNTNVTLDGSFTPTEDPWEVWLWGNFSGCTSGTRVAMFYVWANFA